jgi:surface antigen
MAALSGCHSPYRSDQGALLGGLGGAGVGAIVGKQLGNTGAGAAIGALTGAVAGGVIGNELDEIDARNRREIEARMGRPIAAGAVSIEDVVAMSKAGVDAEVIATHVRNHGTNHPLTPDDLIRLKDEGVNPRVVRAMQEPPRPREVVRTVERDPRPVVVEHYYADPWPSWGPRYYHPYHHRHPGYSVGLSYSN